MRFTALLLPLLACTAAPQEKPATPREHLGHEVGADFKLARWKSVCDYFAKLDASPRVQVSEIGKTTLGAPMILAAISSEANLKNLDRIREVQRLLADPRRLKAEDEAKLLEEARAVLFVTCGLHSSEVAATQMSMELAYDLATKDDAATREILDHCVIVLIPCANPDGLDLVIDWYEQTLGTPWEGVSMPWLYQKYIGHDNNRDWFMLTQKETRVLTKQLYEEWFPVILYDIHQMGNSGARFFVPPFHDPVNPNVHPLIHQQLVLIGGHMATDLAEAGRKGVVTSAIYDNWWHGGNRTTPYRHNITGILSEAASARTASPIFQKKEELKGHARGLSQYQLSTNFVDPWPGGWWRLRDVVDYQLISCRSLFTLAARYRGMFNRNYLSLAREAVRIGSTEPPIAFLVPPDQRDPVAAAEMLEILRLGGVEIHRAKAPFKADDVDYPAGTHVVSMAQPYRNHAKDLLERQHYPKRLKYPGGPAEPPYDVAGWTLPIQMGVRSVSVSKPFAAELEAVSKVDPPEGVIRGESAVGYAIPMRTNDDYATVNRLLKANRKVYVSSQPWGDFAAGTVFVKEKPEKLRSTSAVALEKKPETPTALLKPPRTGLYAPWTASMDEGWTRWILERYEFPYVPVRNDDIRAGALRDRFDAIVIADEPLKEILKGRADSDAPPRYAGGIGDEGAAHLLRFVKEGGTLVLFDGSTQLAIESFKVPVKNSLEGAKDSEFFCPGSILRIDVDTNHPVGFSAAAQAPAYFARSRAFEKTDVEEKPKDKDKEKEPRPAMEAVVVASYSETVLLESGWILGGDRIKGRAAIVEVRHGTGRIVMFAFRPQYRGWPHASFRFLFNSILGSARGEEGFLCWRSCSCCSSRPRRRRSATRSAPTRSCPRGRRSCRSTAGSRRSRIACGSRKRGRRPRDGRSSSSPSPPRQT